MAIHVAKLQVTHSRYVCVTARTVIILSESTYVECELDTPLDIGLLPHLQPFVKRNKSGKLLETPAGPTMETQEPLHFEIAFHIPLCVSFQRVWSCHTDHQESVGVPSQTM